MLTQSAVDEVRFRVLAAVVQSALRKRGTLRGRLHHVWFPEDRITKYVLRDGNPPSDTDRPAHLRRLDLVVDATTIPRHVREVLEPGGLLDQYNHQAKLSGRLPLLPWQAMKTLMEVKRLVRIGNEEELARYKKSWDEAARIGGHFDRQTRIFH